MIQYLKLVLVEIRSKWSTYWFMGMAAVAELPQQLPDSWQYVVGFLPHSWNPDTIHHRLLAAGFLAGIYLRVRRRLGELWKQAKGG